MAGLLVPVADAQISQRFEVSKLDVEFGYYHVDEETARFIDYSGATYSPHFHAGTDFFKGLGAPVVAAEAGHVIHADVALSPGPYGGGGLEVEIQIDGGMRVAVCHLNDITVGLNAVVGRGQLIGHQGETGLTAGIHTHLGVATMDPVTGQYLFRNPEHYLIGGKFADSPLIKPFVAPVVPLVAINGADINIRLGAGLDKTIYARSTFTGIYKVDDTGTTTTQKLFSLNSGFLFRKWVVRIELDGTRNVWCEMATGSGKVLYCASWLVHVIRGTLPPKP